MKRFPTLIFTIVLALFTISCSSNDRSESFTLEGEVANATENEMICLSYPIKRGDVWYEHTDTTYIKDGKFQFSGTTCDLVPALLSLEHMDYVNIYIEPSKIKFSANRDRLYAYSISGLSIDDELSKYKESFAEYNRMLYECQHRLQRKNEEWVQAYDAGLESANTLLEEFYALVPEFKRLTATWPSMVVKFVEENSDFIIAPNLIDGLVYYEDEIATAQRLCDQLSDSQRQSVMGELLSLRLQLTAACGGVVGRRAFDFCLEDLNGECVQLSELYSTGYVLLDFWASWCRPCIGEIPALKALHTSFGDEVQIVSLSSDEDEEQWRKAVSQYGLYRWPQLLVSPSRESESYYFREQADLATIYGIELIPCFILIDKQGFIVGRWSHLTPATIEEIKQIIGKE